MITGAGACAAMLLMGNVVNARDLGGQMHVDGYFLLQSKIGHNRYNYTLQSHTYTRNIVAKL